jgi:sigma-54 dependent transcriptional regulator, acetoin dehydrogenase operon transcriptional activator AcoR
MPDHSPTPDEATLATGGPGVDPDLEARPALINAGHADAGGRSEGGRLFFISDGLELGRRPSPPPGGGTWYIPDGRVSARHARITRQGKTLHIVDLESRNGTFVNGRRIEGPTKLVEGDVILVGRQAAVFRWLTGERTSAIAAELQKPFGPTPALAPAMAIILGRLRALAPTREEVLLTGETGVGKEVYAQALHAASGRKGPFVAINCAALPVELVESELFGYARGAHSQASQSRPGLIAQADGGTLFLDEIGDMPPSAQAKLLRFLQTRSYQPLGASAPRTLDVRVIAATTRAGRDANGEGLRADLAGRLGAEPLVLPPLRQRPEDLGALVAHFLAAAADGQAAAKRLDAAAFAALLNHTWPQNVRELEKVTRQAALFAKGAEVIRPAHLPMRLAEGGAPLEDPLESGDASGDRRPRRPMPDRKALVQLLEQYRGNVAHVARHLDRHWGVVQRALTKHQIDVDAYRPDDEGD